MFITGTYITAKCVSCDKTEEVRATTLCLCRKQLQLAGWELERRFRKATCKECRKDHTEKDHE